MAYSLTPELNAYTHKGSVQCKVQWFQARIILTSSFCEVPAVEAGVKQHYIIGEPLLDYIFRIYKI